MPGDLAKSDGALWLENGLELLSGCFKVIVLGWISGGNSLGILGWFPDLGILGSAVALAGTVARIWLPVSLTTSIGLPFKKMRGFPPPSDRLEPLMVSVGPLKGHAGDQRVGIEGEGFAVARFPAVRAYAKINAAGEWIDRSETVSLNDLFDHMSKHSGAGSLRAKGALPEWFKTTVSAD